MKITSEVINSNIFNGAWCYHVGFLNCSNLKNSAINTYFKKMKNWEVLNAEIPDFVSVTWGW